MASTPSNSKTVVVLGASYGGARAAQVIAAGLPEGWRLVLIDRNSHLNHVYILPRLAVLPGHEHKAFIPYDNIFNLRPSLPSHSLPHHSRNAKCTFIQATILSLTPHSITLSRVVPELGVGRDGVLGFDYAVYALGSRLPEPLDLWGAPSSANCNPPSIALLPPCPNSSSSLTCVDANAMNDKSVVMHAPYGGTKPEGIAWLRRKQRVVRAGEFASDIASVHPTKRVTLLHSRARLLPRFDGGGEGGDGEGGEESGGMHAEILQALHALNVHVVLGERVDLSSLFYLAPSDSGANDTTTARTVRTTTGREMGADLVYSSCAYTFPMIPPPPLSFRLPPHRILPTFPSLPSPSRPPPSLLPNTPLHRPNPNTALLRALDPRVVDPKSGLARVGRGMQLAFAIAPPTEGGDPDADRDAGSGAGIRTKEGATRMKEGAECTPAPAPAPAPADTTDHGDAQDDEDDTSLLAAALAEIDLLDAASGSSSSSSSDDGLEADSLALDPSSDASPPHSLANERDGQAAEPSPSASSPASPSHSLVNEQDFTAEETAVLTPETDEAHTTLYPHFKQEPTSTPYPHIFAIGDAADAFGALPAGHNAWAQGEVAGRNVLRLISRHGASAIADEGEKGTRSWNWRRTPPVRQRSRCRLG
ncbi:hypothetical protein B0H13DRAFT_2299141, partial [Mycena leptocephala]